MKQKKLWVTLCLVNLCILALLGLTLRTKFLFPIPFVDYRNFLSAHSHFAFGGWVTLALMVLYIEKLLGEKQQQKNVYQWLLWGIEISSLGMALSFPFRGYAFFSILFSTTFIFITYLFSWVFIKDILIQRKQSAVKLLSIGALLSLVISSVGPFTLAYIMATKSGNAILYRNAIYIFLHFQYNGLFTLSVFALLFNHLMGNADTITKKRINIFSAIMVISVLPAVFLSLIMRHYNVYVHGIAIAACILLLLSLIYFSLFVFKLNYAAVKIVRLAHLLVVLSLVSFTIKMLLQLGTVIPSLRNTVFGFRPIIIGFLHLVFLGFVSFFILSDFITSGWLRVEKKLAYSSIIFFIAAVIINEVILLVDGIGLMFYSTSQIFPWLLWGAALLLFTGALLIILARAITPRPASNQITLK